MQNLSQAGNDFACPAIAVTFYAGVLEGEGLAAGSDRFPVK